MRTITSSTSNSRTRRALAPRGVTTLAAVCLAIPMALSFAGTAMASGPNAHANAGSNAGGADGAANAASHRAAAAAAAGKPADFVGPLAPTTDATTATPAAASTTASSSDTSPQPPERSTPYVNQGGVTVGSNTNHYETVSDGKGSTFTGVGGGQPSGDITKPQPFSTADQNNTGANDTSATNQYRSTRDGSPSLNGNGGGKQVGQPCAGCVGKADNKNPPGQYPNGTDANAGYECDRNHGIGRSNPAHTGCTAGTTTGGTTGTTTGGGESCVPTAANHHCNTDTPDCVPSAANNHCGTDVPDCKGVMGGHATQAECKTENGGNENGKVTICHATGSATNPFVEITPNENGVVNGHIGHQDGDDIIPPFSYNDHGVVKNFPGQNWTAANQALYANRCTTGGGGNTTTGGQTTGAVTGCPAGTTMVNGTCTPPVSCPAGSTMVNGQCETPAVCPAGPATMVNGQCQLPTACPAGSTMNAAGTCVLPISSTPGGEATTPTEIAQGSTPKAVEGGTKPAAATAGTAAAPAAGLPFTGSDVAFLVECAALMLLVGGGLLVATRKQRAPLAVV